MTDLEGVAQAYKGALGRFEPPSKAVADLFGVSRATASRWVAKCRAAGLLEPNPGAFGRGGHGGGERKVAKIAAALGVPYEDLRAAVIQHAGGDLRIGTSHEWLQGAVERRSDPLREDSLERIRERIDQLRAKNEEPSE